MSGNSWANMGQECIKCHINVYPHKQVSCWAGQAGQQAVCAGRLSSEGHGGEFTLYLIRSKFTPYKDETTSLLIGPFFPCLVWNGGERVPIAPEKEGR